MAKLDEDALLELHTRVRRASSKYVKLYRQTGASRVGLKGARGHARPGNVGNAAKAEVFELALARVSARVDVVARAAAEELKAERLAAAAADAGLDRSGLAAGRRRSEGGRPAPGGARPRPRAGSSATRRRAPRVLPARRRRTRADVSPRRLGGAASARDELPDRRHDADERRRRCRGPRRCGRARPTATRRRSPPARPARSAPSRAGPREVVTMSPRARSHAGSRTM